MKNLNKKISVVVLSGMMVVSGAVSSGISIYANSVGIKASDRSLNDNNVIKLIEGQIKHGYSILAFGSNLKNLKEQWNSDSSRVPYDDLLVRHFKDINSFLNQADSLSKYDVYRLQIGKDYYIIKFDSANDAKKNFMDSKKNIKPFWFINPDEAKPELVANPAGNVADVIGVQNIYKYKIFKYNVDESEMRRYKPLGKGEYKDGNAFLNYLFEKGMPNGRLGVKVGNQRYILDCQGVNSGIEVDAHVSDILPSAVSNIAKVMEMQGVLNYRVLDCNPKDRAVEEYGLKGYRKEKQKLYDGLNLKVEKFKDGSDFVLGMMLDGKRPKDEHLHRINVGGDEFIIQFAKVDFSKDKVGM